MSDPILSRTNQLKLSNIQPSDLGNYVVTIKNSSGEVTSKVVQVLAAVSPSLGVDLPASQDISESTTVTLEVTLAAGTGLPSPTYQWKKDGQDIVGATSSSYTTLWSRSDSGDYSCVVSNKAGTITSTTNTVRVTYAPEISTQPSPSTQTINEGGAVAYEVVADGVPSVSYQWKKDGTPLGGETSSVLVLASLATGDSAVYTCDVTNAVDTVTTSGVTLLVVQDLPIFTVQPQSDVVAPSGTIIFTAQTELAVTSFTWKKAGVAVNESDPDITVTSNVSAGTTQLQIDNLVAGDAGAYTVTATNASGSTTSTIAVLTVSTESPSISVQPVAEVAVSGATVQFFVVADSAPSPTYQWYKDSIGNPLSDGGDIAGALTDTLTISNADGADEGNYFVRVTNPDTLEYVDSNTASLGIEVAPAVTIQPTNQAVDESGNAVFSLTATGTGLQYQWFEDPAGTNTPLIGATSSTLILYGVNVGDSGKTYRCRVYNGAGDDLSDIVTLTVYETIAITSQPAASVTKNEAETLTLSVGVTGTSPTYQWQRNGVDLDPGTTNGFGNVSGETSATLTITGLTTTAGGSYTCIIDNDHSDPAVTSNACTLTVNALAAPSFAAGTQPTNQSEAEGDFVNFSSLATGNPTPTYQWQYDDGVSGFQNLVVGGTEGYDAYAILTPYDVNDVVSFGGQVYKCLVAGTSDNADITLDGGCTWDTPQNAYSGITANNLSIYAASSTLNGFSFRCIATNSQGTDTSSTATLTVT